MRFFTCAKLLVHLPKWDIYFDINISKYWGISAVWPLENMTYNPYIIFHNYECCYSLFRKILVSYYKMLNALLLALKTKCLVSGDNKRYLKVL